MRPAEEEQLRAEQELSALMQQMRTQQPGTGIGNSSSGGGADAAQMQADLEALLAEVDSLRRRLREAEQCAAAGGGAGAAGGAAGEPGAEGLAQRVAALKASRDKLIAALDTQAAEVERLSAENASLLEVGDQGFCISRKMIQQALRRMAENASLWELGDQTHFVVNLKIESSKQARST